jgi:hypothetical protein
MTFIPDIMGIWQRCRNSAHSILLLPHFRSEVMEPVVCWFSLPDPWGQLGALDLQSDDDSWLVFRNLEGLLRIVLCKYWLTAITAISRRDNVSDLRAQTNVIVCHLASLTFLSTCVLTCSFGRSMRNSCTTNPIPDPNYRLFLVY